MDSKRNGLIDILENETKNEKHRVCLNTFEVSRSRMLHMKTKTEVAIELLISPQIFAGGS